MSKEQEFKKIVSAFERVKKDMFFLTQKVSRLENAKKESEKKLNKEIEVLKLKIYTLENQKILNQEEHYFIGNADSKKVHLSNCPFSHKISEENLVRFEDINQALNKGYDTCSCTHN